MAHIIPYDEIEKTSENVGWMESLYMDEEGTEKMIITEAVVFDNTSVSFIHSCGDMPDREEYNRIIKPTHDEYVEFTEEDDKTLLCGRRIWDKKPTEEEMVNTPWEVE